MFNDDNTFNCLLIIPSGIYYPLLYSKQQIKRRMQILCLELQYSNNYLILSFMPVDYFYYFRFQSLLIRKEITTRYFYYKKLLSEVPKTLLEVCYLHFFAILLPSCWQLPLHSPQHFLAIPIFACSPYFSLSSILCFQLFLFLAPYLCLKSPYNSLQPTKLCLQTSTSACECY